MSPGAAQECLAASASGDGLHVTRNRDYRCGFQCFMPIVSRDIVVSNKLGLHARPAMQFVDLANQFQSKVTVSKGGDEPYEADGKSVMQMIILAATEGTTLKILADGEDAQAAVEKLAQLFNDKFGEE
jgi:phosphocarrier protein